MYTNSLLGTAYDVRHVWRPAAQERLEQAKHDGVYAEVPSECGEVSAIFEPGDEQQYALLLVPVREYDVPCLPAFLHHDATCQACGQAALDLVGLADPETEERLYEGAYSLKDTSRDLEEPEQAVQRYHQQETAEVRRQWYDEAEDEDSQALQEALNAALGRCRINSYGSPMHVFLRGQGEPAVCGERLAEVPLPDSTDPGQQGLFDARNNYDTLGGLLEDWLPDGNDAYCTECAKGLAEQTDTLRGFTEDALLRYARGHERASEA